MPPSGAALAGAVAMLVAACGAGCGPSRAVYGARFDRQVPWIGRGTWISADTHVHSQFSVPDVVSNTVTTVAERAAHFGVRVLALTDHGFAPESASAAEVAAVAAARAAHPELIMPVGLEWDMPHGGTTEHAAILLPEGDESWALLREIKARFSCRPEPCDRARGDEGLRWLADQTRDAAVRPVIMLNHPTKERLSSLDLVADVKRLATVSDLVVGFEGGPGHQGSVPPGLYSHERPIDRWDPAVARVGDAWDVLLGEGLDVWGARASSDSHSVGTNPPQDYWPGELSETWLYVGEESTAGALEALRAGTFFGVEGRIARAVELSVKADGLARPAQVGEIIAVPEGETVQVALRLQVPDEDWRGDANRVDLIELIAVTASGAEVIAARAPEAGPQPGARVLSEPLVVPRGGAVVRARGRRIVEPGDDLVFYTNPIRIRAIDSGPATRD